MCIVNIIRSCKTQVRLDGALKVGLFFYLVGKMRPGRLDATVWARAVWVQAYKMV